MWKRQRQLDRIVLYMQFVQWYMYLLFVAGCVNVHVTTPTKQMLNVMKEDNLLHKLHVYSYYCLWYTLVNR
jgi:hypothetical protein